MKYKVRDADSDSQRPSDMGLEEKLERTIRCSSVLIISLAGCLVLLGVYTAVLLITEHTNPPPCLTEACVTTSSRVLSALNKDISPCTDFYEFACGGWIKKNPVPEWATSWDQLAKLREQLTVDLRDLLEAGDEPNSPKSVLKAKALYRTCVDTEPPAEPGPADAAAQRGQCQLDVGGGGRTRATPPGTQRAGQPGASDPGLQRALLAAA
ncbi:unnamed protein product [Leptidea sinapis]|uniref:Peptidase M13 N-terminal domain-containing protein n=1 Tax=Leptidea sinapis TaxID=189913 RepID=A0A5E4Q1M6_9NEOP|nr:unnamed protein product [Leptidea sinapis]